MVLNEMKNNKILDCRSKKSALVKNQSTYNY